MRSLSLWAARSALRSVRRTALALELALAFLGAVHPDRAGAAEGGPGTVEQAPALTNAGEVLGLGRERAKSGRSVDLEAVLTLPNWDRPTWSWVQAGTNAALIVHTNRFVRRTGARVRVRGRTASGEQTPVFINDAQVDVLGDGVMPEPLRMPVAHLFRPEFTGRWIEHEGVVRSVDRSEGAYRIVMAADDAPVEALFYVAPGQPGPTAWLGRRLRMQGVCVTSFDAEGRVFGFMLHVPGTNHVIDLLRSNEPLSPPASAPPRITADSMAEALANLGPLTDPPQSPANLTNTLPVLTNVQQVLNLGLDGARTRPHPVRVIGVIIFPLPSNRSLYIDDGTGGIEVVYGYTDRLPERPPGMLVWVDGIVGTGPFRPWIAEARIKPLGTVPLPPAKRPPAAELGSEKWHGQWIEVEGVVRDLTRSSTLDLLIAVGGKHVEVVLPYSGRLRPPLEWLDARISARGLCDVPVDYLGRPTQTRLFLNTTNDLKILRDGTTDVFGRPTSPPAQYREAPLPSDVRIKIEGTVLFHAEDGRLFLHDGAGAVQAEALSVLVRRSSRTVGIDRPPREKLRPGDRVEMVGALACSTLAPRFLDAEYRRLGAGSAPEPLRITAAEASSGRHDAMLVTLRARVVAREMHSTPTGGRQEALLLEEGGIVFEALNGAPHSQALPATGRDTIVEVTGVCLAFAPTDGHGRNFRLLLRDAGSLRVLGQAAPWQSLQPGKILAVSGGLGALALAWVFLLRGQVQRRTADLRGANEQLQREVAQRRLAEEGLRASEARKTAVLESALDSIISIDQHGRIIDFNPAAEKTFGYSRSEALGRELAETIIPPVHRERHRAGLRRAVDTGVDTMIGRRIEVPALRRNGEEFTVELALSRIPDRAGPIFTAHIQDISERKRAEVERERALAHEKELSELKSRFVSMVSHEFRTPLGIITSSAEILEAYLDRLPPEERRSNLRDITDATRHMARMMEEVLLLGRVEAGKLACRPAPLDLAIFCRRLAEEMTSVTGGRCPILTTAAADVEAAEADENLLRHIFTNLLGNASKYSAPGSPVEFGVEARGPLAVFTVRDRGIGIAEQDARQLFQAFHRGANVGDTPGTGLGMTIVKRCVELHGGRISFQSEVGRGTMFVIELPVFAAGSCDQERSAKGEAVR